MAHQHHASSAASSSRGFRLWPVIVVLALGAAGAYHYFSKPGGPAQQAGKAVPVTVVTAKQEHVRIWAEFPGRTRPVDFAEIRPEVSGRITELRFADGQLVKAGDVLAVIDPRSYEADLIKAKALLQSSRTTYEFARKEAGRAEEMIKTKAIAQRSYDERINERRVAEAAVSAAEAQLAQAELNVEHAYVRAPISGRTSRAEVTVGNLVQAGPGAPLLTSIVSDDGIYVDFDVDEQFYVRSIRRGASSYEQEQKIPVELVVPGVETETVKGTIHTFDNRINPGTGTIRARAKFANEAGTLIPGMFVAVRLSSSAEENVVMVPERALATDQDKKYVYAVGPENKVQYRVVKLGGLVAGKRVVLSGINDGDRVIVTGMQHVKPDAVVEPSEAAPEGQPPAQQQAGGAKTANTTDAKN